MPHHLLRYDLAPDFLARRGDHRSAHLALAWRYADEGWLLLGGAIGDPVESALLLFADAASAAAFAAADPYVAHGLVVAWRIVPWTTVVGRNAADPIRPST